MRPSPTLPARRLAFISLVFASCRRPNGFLCQAAASDSASLPQPAPPAMPADRPQLTLTSGPISGRNAPPSRQAADQRTVRAIGSDDRFAMAVNDPLSPVESSEGHRQVSSGLLRSALGLARGRPSKLRRPLRRGSNPDATEHTIGYDIPA